ncbi:TrkH family potassium uptake protein [Niameybacter massiliensis]|uniref:TrkH family potassium uptake protein n=1 Tax=Holtiella tumoricola TaxID=3018743 RepID=A0AA42DLQ8_9FIRM|nr:MULTISPECIES: TrkH family potassium uptake protein [Lachnospirales]MDA3731245.1 TrkH family potassium uptake protein [Holtiella tumoricola]
MNNLNEQHGIFKSSLGPSQILVAGFLCLILVATVLLMLPISSQSGETTNFVDALFTSTSAVCVTGLVVVNTLEHWSLFGKIIILFCIQIGGLGFMSLVSMIFVFMGKKITLKNRLIMQEAFSSNTVAGIVRFTKAVVMLTFFVEGIGAFLLSFVFVPEHGLIKGIGYSIFHAISAFCNAGFDLVGSNSLTPYVGNGLVNFTIMGLIIAGGLGFCVWMDTYNMIKIKRQSAEHFTWKQAFYKMPLHTKLVWLITIFLIVFGFLFFFIVEFKNPSTLGALSFKDKLYASLFQSVSPRTAGFNTLPLADLTPASKLMTIILMFIGGSPAGTAGGVKTVTIGVLILCAMSTIKGRESTEIYNRRIPGSVITRALTVIMIAITAIFGMLMILTVTENVEFLDLLFEVVSAFATVGLTLGITASLTTIGKIMIIILMFIGRLGPVTIAVALMVRQKKAKEKQSIQYPEEKVMVG